MSTSTIVCPTFTFGVEIELLLKPKEGTDLYEDLKNYHFDPTIQPGPTVEKTKRDHNRNAIRQALAVALTGFNIPATMEGSGYRTWYVKEEGSLTEVVDARGGGYWAIELNFDIQLTRGCSMHVHIAPKPNWDASSLRNFMKAAGVFDDAIMKIMPADRKMNPWARSNFHDGPKAEGKVPPKMKRAFDEVPAKTWKPFFALFDSAKMKAHLLLEWGQDRCVAWNFGPLSRCGTVEFRRPPGVMAATDAQKWAAFAVAFVCAATQSNWQAPWLSSKRHASVAELQSFVGRGIDLLGWKTLLNPRGIVENTSPAVPLEYFDLEEVNRKLAKAKRESGFEEKIIRSRQNSPASSHSNSPTSRKASSRSNSPASVRSNSPANRGARSESPVPNRPNPPRTRLEITATMPVAVAVAGARAGARAGAAP
ncbi:hypothetical protein C7999DRAFT_39747 [Corynascus novoguineensis]|uniref:Uncharacterized protein n=1 Tax=Corynascus novoguineensis TaxID=1126955 RepID=A0AAN7HGQ9_9PEZI|nr:hypothetical protein C7999DRAFT_39747 [Corynascus novoguineensis]